MSLSPGYSRGRALNWFPRPALRDLQIACGPQFTKASWLRSGRGASEAGRSVPAQSVWLLAVSKKQDSSRLRWPMSLLSVTGRMRTRDLFVSPRFPIRSRGREMERVSEVLQFPVVIEWDRPFPLDPQPL